MAETSNESTKRERPRRKKASEERTVGETADEPTNHDEEAMGVEGVEEIEEVREEEEGIGKPAAEEAREKVTPPERLPHRTTILQEVMRIPSFRRRVISHLVKSLR